MKLKMFFLLTLTLLLVLLVGCSSVAMPGTLPLYKTVEDAAAGNNAIKALSSLNGAYYADQVAGSDNIWKISATGEITDATKSPPAYYVVWVQEVQTPVAGSVGVDQNTSTQPDLVTQVLAKIEDPNIVFALLITVAVLFGFLMGKIAVFFQKTPDFAVDLSGLVCDGQAVEKLIVEVFYKRSSNAARTPFWRNHGYVVRQWGPQIKSYFGDNIIKTQFSELNEKIRQLAKNREEIDLILPPVGADLVSIRVGDWELSQSQKSGFERVWVARQEGAAMNAITDMTKISPDGASKHLLGTRMGEAANVAANSLSGLAGIPSALLSLGSAFASAASSVVSVFASKEADGADKKGDKGSEKDGEK